MKNFLVQIHAYQYTAKFEVLAEDNAPSIEQAILDKLGKKTIKWECMENAYDLGSKRITYEEVIYDPRPIQQKKSLELNWEQEYNENGKYTLNMIQIDHKIKEIITQIKAEEARIADRENKILDSQAEVSIAT